MYCWIISLVVVALSVWVAVRQIASTKKRAQEFVGHFSPKVILERLRLLAVDSIEADAKALVTEETRRLGYSESMAHDYAIEAADLRSRAFLEFVLEAEYWGFKVPREKIVAARFSAQHFRLLSRDIFISGV